MNDKFLCVMAGYDEATEEYLSGIQRSLYESGFVGRQTRDIPHHITLGTFDCDREDNIINLVKSVGSNTAAFDITFNHIGVFGGSRVLFIAPDANYNLLKLQGCFSEGFGWTPHTTMLIDEPDNIFRALPVAAQQFHSFEGKIESLHLYEFWPTRHIVSVKLQSQHEHNEVI